MAETLIAKLLAAHELEPDPAGLPLGAEGEIALRPGHVAIGEQASTLVVPGFESLGRARAVPALALACADRHAAGVAFKQAVDLAALQAWARRRGVWFSRPGNGSTDHVHRERYAAPGKLVIRPGRRPPTAGALGMLGLACGELEAAAALAGAPLYRRRPEVMAVRLFGALGAWAGGQDLALDLLRRLASPEGGAAGAASSAAGPGSGAPVYLEYGGPGLASLGQADRVALAAHATALGAQAAVFPSDDITRQALAAQGRDADWKRLEADEGCTYDRTLDLDLSLLEPLATALDDLDGVRPAAHWAGVAIAQVVIGPGASFADLALAARILAAHPVHEGVQLVVVPGSRQIEEAAAREGVLEILVRAGARVSDGTGMPAGDGKAAGLCFGLAAERLPAGRARWYLAGPGCCAAAAVTGRLCDPRELEVEFSRDLEPARYPEDPAGILEPAAPDAAEEGEAPPRVYFPRPAAVESGLRGVVLLRLGDEVDTDQVLPWGARVTPLIGDLAALAEHAFAGLDPEFAARARQRHGGFVVAGARFGIGEPRLFAALALLELGVRATLAISYAPAFHAQLVEAGILPLLFTGEADALGVAPGDELEIPGLGDALEVGRALTARNLTRGVQYTLRHDLGALECAIARAGGRLPYAARTAMPAAPAAPASRGAAAGPASPPARPAGA